MATTNDLGVTQIDGAPQVLPQVKIAIIGSSGFLGSRLTSHGQGAGLSVVPVEGPRVAPRSYDDLGRAVERWYEDNGKAFDAVCGALVGFDVVVNAVGMAKAGSADEAALRAANTVQPALVARACHRAGVRRLVHLSTAAVQGRLDPLDETPRQAPFSPYTRSKAAAERHLLDIDVERPPEVVLYRPASVHAVERATTRCLARLAAAPVVPVVGNGDHPLPFALVENVVAGVLFCAISTVAPPIVVQPDEGMTSRAIFRLFGARRTFPIPRAALGLGLAALRRASAQLPSLSTFVRGVELLFLGQRVAASSLTSAGFVPPAGPEAWASLASSLRRPAGAARPTTSVPTSAPDGRR